MSKKPITSETFVDVVKLCERNALKNYVYRDNLLYWRQGTCTGSKNSSTIVVSELQGYLYEGRYLTLQKMMDNMSRVGGELHEIIDELELNGKNADCVVALKFVETVERAVKVEAKQDESDEIVLVAVYKGKQFSCLTDAEKEKSKDTLRKAFPKLTESEARDIVQEYKLY